MYSVEDLLISHGYKLSRDVPAPHEDHYERRQPARTRARAGLLNGCEDGPAAFPRSKASLRTGHGSDPENDRHALRVHGGPQSTSAAIASEAGFYHQPMLAWSSQPQSGHNHAYWRRGQEVSGLLGPRNREDLEVRGMAQAHSLPVHTREGPWEVGGRTENVMKKAVWEEELRMEGPAKWQNVSLESWNQPRKLGRQMSDGDREKLFQDLYPFMRGEHVLNSQSKGKSRSLPRVLSPESMSCMEILLRDGHLPSVPKMPFYPPNGAPILESARNPEKGGSSVPLSRPKFGRPLKPPSYDSHQHSRGGVDSSEYLDSQLTDLSVSYLTQTSDARQELCLPDSGLEPPVYVPPPSYRSPPQHISNPYVEDLASRPAHDDRRHLMEEAAASCQFPSGSLGSGIEYGVSPHSPRRFPQEPRPTTSYDGSVLYIPFDDPRIRHIKLAQPQGFCEETKVDEKLYNSGLVSAPESAHGYMYHDGAILNPQSMRPPSGNERGPAEPSPRWLGSQLPRDGENGGFSDQRDHCVMRGQWADVSGSQQGQAESHVSSPNPQGESTCETRTKLKKFETGIQTKKSSKKKMNETIFCLVSIPVKTESHLPDTDTNNNDLKQSADKEHGVGESAALQERSLLSTSSTDLELQALTGSMAGRTEFQKQDLGEPEEGKQTDDLRFIHPMKHRELKYSGSWPGYQYRDQQTQTTFTEESKSLTPLPDEKLGGSLNAGLTPTFLDSTASEAQRHMALASSDQNQRPSARHLKGQLSLNPSSYSAFSRTSSSINHAPVPEAGQSQPCVDGHAASPVPRGEVVKGATTGPCNSQQLFGQFLLKPVSRRPWDLISQLESFNKELQEEEESSHSSTCSEHGETEWQPEGRADSTPSNLGFSENSQERRTEELPRRLVPEGLVFRSGRVKSKSESWSEEQKPATHHLGARPQSPGPLQSADRRGEALLSTHGRTITEKRNEEVEKRIKELAISPGPVKRVMSSRSSVIKPVSPSDPAGLREPQESQELPSVSSSVELSKATPPKAGGGEQRGLVVPLSLASKPRGVSAPDLRSVGLTPAREWSADELDGSSGDASAIEIPPHESLQARAVRILGIEVAVESLLPGARRTGQSHHPEPDGSAHRPASPREEPVSNAAQPDEPTVSTDAFYGRRKCGWTESPLFVGERDSARWAPWASERSGVDGAVPSKAPDPEPQPSAQESRPSDHKDVGTKPPFRSTLFHVIERTPSAAGSQKLRSTSRVIESLQEKLASPPRRADPGRLMRMKEVSSVSRMRLLSSRGSDSLEEAREPKAERGPGAPPRGLLSLTPEALACREGAGLSVSKSALSWEENGHLAAGREKRNVDQDLWCPDSYDPSRVERV